jgi:hypothetical protein
MRREHSHSHLSRRPDRQVAKCFSFVSKHNFVELRVECCDMSSMRIVALEKYRRHTPAGYFLDLPPEVRRSAYRWLDRFCKRWRGDLPGWRLAILVGQARRLALNPPTSAWGRSMLAKRGGLAVQRKCRLEGRHPTERATRSRLQKLNAKKRATAEARERVDIDLADPARVFYLPLE